MTLQASHLQVSSESSIALAEQSVDLDPIGQVMASLDYECRLRHSLAWEVPRSSKSYEHRESHEPEVWAGSSKAHNQAAGWEEEVVAFVPGYLCLLFRTKDIETFAR